LLKEECPAMSKLILIVLAIASGLSGQTDSPPAGKIGVQVGDFRVIDTTGQFHSLSEFKGKKAVVVTFIGTQCPISNSYMPTLIELHDRYARQGVQFLAINANDQDSLEEVRAHAQERKIPFPVLKDSRQDAVAMLDARRTPEAFLLDAKLVVRYRGRIDDQYGYAYRRASPKQTELKDAIEELLAGKPISVPVTKVQGCKISRTAKGSSSR
jgi:peroxiredoxin